MAKRIRIGVPGVRLNESMHAALAIIALRARTASKLACQPVQVPLADFMDEMGLAQSSVIRSIHALEESGLVESKAEWLDCGAQAANAYSLTALGIEVLRLADSEVSRRHANVA